MIAETSAPARPSAKAAAPATAARPAPLQRRWIAGAIAAATACDIALPWERRRRGIARG
jgi:hypothetical protein